MAGLLSSQAEMVDMQGRACLHVWCLRNLLGRHRLMLKAIPGSRAYIEWPELGLYPIKL